MFNVYQYHRSVLVSCVTGIWYLNSRHIIELYVILVPLLHYLKKKIIKFFCMQIGTPEVFPK